MCCLLVYNYNHQYYICSIGSLKGFTWSIQIQHRYCTALSPSCISLQPQNFCRSHLAIYRVTQKKITFETLDSFERSIFSKLHFVCWYVMKDIRLHSISFKKTVWKSVIFVNSALKIHVVKNTLLQNCFFGNFAHLHKFIEYWFCSVLYRVGQRN